MKSYISALILLAALTLPASNAEAATYDFLEASIVGASGKFTSPNGNGVITASTAGGPFLSANNTVVVSKFPALFPSSGSVTGYLAQADDNANYTVTFDLSGYSISAATVFGMWNITEEDRLYRITALDSANNVISPPFGWNFIGHDDDALAGNIGWYHMSLDPASGFLQTANFKSSGTDCDAAFWDNLDLKTAKIVVTGRLGPADGVGFYFAELEPCIKCPENISVTTCSNSADVVYPAPTLSDPCTTYTVSCNPPSGSSFPLGTTTVTCTAFDPVDPAGVAERCAFDVTVSQETTPWVLRCPPAGTVVDVVGCPPRLPNLRPFLSVITNCPFQGPLTLTVIGGDGSVMTNGTPLQAGTTVVTAQVCDPEGRCQICDITIHAAATSGNPTLQCPPDQVLIACSNTATGWYQIGAGNYSGTISCSPPSGSAFPLGVTSVNCTATNECGGVATCSFTFTVKRAPVRWPCPPKHLGLGIPFELIGGATAAVVPGGSSSGEGPAITITPNAGAPASGILLQPGPAQGMTLTTLLDFNAVEDGGVDFRNPLNPGGEPILGMRSKGRKGYCVKTAKFFEEQPDGLWRFTAVNSNGALLGTLTFTTAEIAAGDPFIINGLPGVSNCHVSVDMSFVDGTITVGFEGPVVPSAERKGWDGCIYGPDRPVKKPKSHVIIKPPNNVPHPITEIELLARGVPALPVEDPSITATAGRKWGDGHVTLMKAYDDGESMEFRAMAPGGGVHVDLGHSESFTMKMTHFENGDVPTEEQLLTRTIGPIRGLTNRPPPPFLDAMLLAGSPGAVTCSADFSNIDSPTVHVMIFSNGVMVAERRGVTGSLDNPLFVLPDWPDSLGKLGRATPCRVGTVKHGTIRIPTGAGFGLFAATEEIVMGDEFRVVAEPIAGAAVPDYYSRFEFITSEDADWGVSDLDRVLACPDQRLSISRSSSGVEVGWENANYRLQGAEAVTGPWYDLNVPSPVSLEVAGTYRFFRLACD